MKKLSFLAMGFLAIASSCSNDETILEPSNEGNAMGFSAFVNNGVSSRADLKLDNLDKFKVWGSTWTDGTDLAQVFTAQEVSKVNNAWTYSPLRYWIKGNNYRFSAIAPADGNFTVTQSLEKPRENPQGGVAIDFDAKSAAGQQDLIYAFNYLPTVAANQAPVDLEFKHLLSRVMFTFQNQCKSSSIGLKIEDLKITDAAASASINMVGADADDVRKWVLGTDTYAQSFTMTSAGTQIFKNDADNMTEGFAVAPSNSFYLVPSEVTEREYTVTFTLGVYSWSEAAGEQGKFVLLNTYDKTVTIPAMTMSEGFSYNFVAALNESNIADEELLPIEFNVTAVEDWGAFEDKNTGVPQKPEVTE